MKYKPHLDFNPEAQAIRKRVMQRVQIECRNRGERIDIVTVSNVDTMVSCWLQYKRTPTDEWRHEIRLWCREHFLIPAERVHLTELLPNGLDAELWKIFEGVDP